MTVATPRMISQSGLVCFPVATNALAGRRIASMSAHASTTNAATARTKNSHVSGEYAVNPENTAPTYLVAVAAGTWSLGSGQPTATSVLASVLASSEPAARAAPAASSGASGQPTAAGNPVWPGSLVSGSAVSDSARSRSASAAARASASARTSLRNDS